MDEITFDRKPYKVQYRDMHGELKTIRRRPPAKVHDMLPTDIVELTQKKNDDWVAGGEFKVRNINPRNPNVLQIEKKNGEATFVPYFDLNLIEPGVNAPGRRYEVMREKPASNNYLLWP